jgi:hypothetical protein
MALQMQQPLLVRPSCKPLSAPAPSFHGLQTFRHSALLAVPTRRRAGYSTRVQAFGSTAAWAATSDTAWLSSVASALGFAIAGLFIARELALEQVRFRMSGPLLGSCLVSSRVGLCCPCAYFWLDRIPIILGRLHWLAAW